MSAEGIRRLNDAFRASFTGGKVIMTSGVAKLSDDGKAAVLERVRTFTAFSDGNDPYREHDFGSFEHEGIRYAFKIDYFDTNLEYGSPNPADPSVTTRVLTIMRLDEY